MVVLPAKVMLLATVVTVRPSMRVVLFENAIVPVPPAVLL
jgi:hypothetical protein